MSFIKTCYTSGLMFTSSAGNVSDLHQLLNRHYQGSVGLKCLYDTVIFVSFTLSEAVNESRNDCVILLGSI